MRAIRHITPRYIINRLAVMAYQWSNPTVPWLTRSANAILLSWLKPTDRGLEWGSGRSTVWLAGNVAHLTTIEEDPCWGESVKTSLCSAGLSQRVDLILATIADHDTAAGSSPYVRAADLIPPGSLDFCIVDGAVRDHCAILALSRLREGGLLIIDNVERYLPRVLPSSSPNARSLDDGPASNVWRLFMMSVAEWRCIWTTDGISDTAIWVKPFDSQPNETRTRRMEASEAEK
ncbi:MAG: class I SAM-dependent methyltransferase [Verrucomicrobiales bacterium]|nr:class I SAM-dependent methyltransferase [Verrucomicrobiales bacterium]